MWPMTDHQLSCRNMFSKEVIGKMKKGAFLVNNARGAIVDREAVVEACKSGQLAGELMHPVCLFASCLHQLSRQDMLSFGTLTIICPGCALCNLDVAFNGTSLRVCCSKRMVSAGQHGEMCDLFGDVNIRCAAC